MDISVPELPTSTATRPFYRSYVDFLHRHHRLKSAPRLVATAGERLREHSGRDLPRQSPTIFTPAASALPAAIVDYGIPVSVGFLLVICRDLK
jgi:hypothetical protein